MLNFLFLEFEESQLQHVVQQKHEFVLLSFYFVLEFPLLFLVKKQGFALRFQVLLELLGNELLRHQDFEQSFSFVLGKDVLSSLLDERKKKIVQSLDDVEARFQEAQAKLENAKQNLASSQEKAEEIQAQSKTTAEQTRVSAGQRAEAEILRIQGTKNSTLNVEKQKLVRTDWETKLSAAEAVVADSEEPTEEQKNSAIELRKVADEAFKVQDDLFAKKRAAAEATTELDSKKADLESLKGVAESIESAVSEIEAMVEQYQADVAECESKLQELLTKLPLESRRGYEEPQPEPEPEVESEPQPEENQDDQTQFTKSKRNCTFCSS
jgi:chromosome segregation ATPase